MSVDYTIIKTALTEPMNNWFDSINNATSNYKILPPSALLTPQAACPCPPIGSVDEGCQNNLYCHRASSAACLASAMISGLTLLAIASAAPPTPAAMSALRAGLRASKFHQKYRLREYEKSGSATPPRQQPGIWDYHPEADAGCIDRAWVTCAVAWI